MPRFFAEPAQIEGDHISITGSDVNHIRNVLRMTRGEELTVSDGAGTDYFCSIEDMETGQVRLRIIDRWPSYAELPVKLYLFQGLPKADKMELIIQKAVELGACEIIPVSTHRSVVKLDGKKEGKKLERWQAIAESAAKQAGRGLIPKVGTVMSFKQALEKARELDAVLVPYEKADGMAAARELLHSMKGKKSIGIFIGPEGGFEDSEIQEALAMGAGVMTLGHRILRTETAGLTMLSVLMFELEEDR